MNYEYCERGIHAVVDGQFGSTGKGVIASKIARMVHKNGVTLNYVYSNAGPNSGHTFYHNGEKHVLKQLPTAAVKSNLLGVKETAAVLTGGAVIDIDILLAEAVKYPELDIIVHPNAAVITKRHKELEKTGSIAAVAGTRSGTGAAIADKILRYEDAVFLYWFKSGNYNWPSNIYLGEIRHSPNDHSMMEVSQGFSLGINSQFYPKVTSRECTVMQGLADARIPPTAVRTTTLSIRTYPIRVGNVDGYSSGDYYADQEETSWEELGVTPELTTVTQRVRRVFTFSHIQLKEAMMANDPTHIFLNFMNYLTEAKRAALVGEIAVKYPNVRLLLGYGPTDEDVH